ncbi:hypothetical protein [Paenibacillus periandrae]|uniref:hypothetical protein n=1 Tax=Paenibacillus periandrae TaxID=1761741 RepID=UPI001F0898DE|nr:hypothetical protein [Paenibacillus periandrae]
MKNEIVDPRYDQMKTLAARMIFKFGNAESPIHVAAQYSLMQGILFYFLGKNLDISINNLKVFIASEYFVDRKALNEFVKTVDDLEAKQAFERSFYRDGEFDRSILLLVTKIIEKTDDAFLKSLT